MTAINSKSYLYHLNKLVDECINNHHCSIGKKRIDADHFPCLKKLRQILKNLKSLELVIESELLIRNIFSKVYTENWSKEIIICWFCVENVSTNV